MPDFPLTSLKPMQMLKPFMVVGTPGRLAELSRDGSLQTHKCACACALNLKDLVMLLLLIMLWATLSCGGSLHLPP